MINAITIVIIITIAIFIGIVIIIITFIIIVIVIVTIIIIIIITLISLNLISKSTYFDVDLTSSQTKIFVNPNCQNDESLEVIMVLIILIITTVSEWYSVTMSKQGMVKQGQWTMRPMSQWSVKASL